MIFPTRCSGTSRASCARGVRRACIALRAHGARAATLVLVALLAAATSCSRSGDALETTHAFGPQDQMSTVRAHDEGVGAVPEDTRPAIGAPRAVAVRPVGSPFARDGRVVQAYKTGPRYPNATLVLARAVRRKDEKEWRRLEPTVGTSRDRSLEIDFALDGEDPARHEVYAEAYAVPAPEESFTTGPIEIEPGSYLVGGFGLSPLALGLSRAAVEFRILARAGDVAEVVLEESLATDDPQQHGWKDYRLDLSRFAGETVSFELRTRFVHGGDDAAPTAVALPAWSTPRIVAPRPDSKHKNVVLISLDTLRADFVGAYGENNALTPNLDALAAQGAFFTWAFTTYPSTTASHMSMLTGLYPSVHGVYAPGKRLAPEIRTLSEILRDAGYQTVAVTENGMMTRNAGFGRGFGVYREFKDLPLQELGLVDDVVTSAIAWLDQHRDERFFMFLHTYQVHDPYEPPPAFDVFKTYQEDGRTRRVDDTTPRAVRSRLGYAGNVLYADSEIGRLLRHLDAIGERDRTVVIVTSDHGEALGEHGAIGHGWFTMDAVLHVPLLIRAPGEVPPGVRVDVPVSLVDIAPTVLALAGVEQTTPMQGKSLLDLLEEVEPEDASRLVYSELVSAMPNEPSIVFAHDRTSKWIASDDDHVVRFDLLADPDENEELTGEDDVAPGRVAAHAYHEWNESMRRTLSEPDAAPVDVDDATTRKLRALGYVE